MSRAEGGEILLLGSGVLVDAGEFLAGGGVLVRGGKVDRLLPRPPRRPRARVVDLRPWVLVPGLVDAHAHLDLSASGTLRGSGSFAGWIRRVVRARRATAAAAVLDGVRRGADELLRGGVTAVADFDGSTRTLRGLGDSPLRAVVLRESIAPSEAEAPLELRRAAAWLGSFRRTPRRAPGLAPHAPFTASLPLVARLGALARARRLPLAIHLAETPEETEFLVKGRGPLRDLLEERGRLPRGWRPPGLRPFEFLEAAGALGASTLLVHGNEISSGEASRAARARAPIVVCPGTHLHFHRSDFPAARLRRCGASVALGTDGRASNDALDLFLEMARFRRLAPRVPPDEVFRAATVNAAGALRLPAGTGTLRPGAPADVLAVDAPAAAGRVGVLDCVTRARPPVRAVFVGGRAAVEPGPAGRYSARDRSDGRDGRGTHVRPGSTSPR